MNEQQGHEGGDKLLQQVAKRLSSELRSGDTLARVTGVEFIIILETASAKGNVNTVADKNFIKAREVLQNCHARSLHHR